MDALASVLPSPVNSRHKPSNRILGSNELSSAANEKKHGISFDEARTVFFDENAKLIDDSDHSNDEDRFQIFNFAQIATPIFNDALLLIEPTTASA